MDLTFRQGDETRETAGALIVPVAAANGAADFAGPAGAVDAALDGELARLAADARFAGNRGATLTVATLGRLPARRVVLAGVGPLAKLDADALRRAWGAAAIAARDAGATEVVSALPPAAAGLDQVAALAAAAEGVQLALYRFTKHYGAGRKDDATPREIATFRFVGTTIDGAGAERALARAAAIAGGVALARDLVNEPASVITPETLAEAARRVAAENDLTIDVLGPDELTAMGANAIVAVGGGSAHPPRLIRLGYRPETEGGGRRGEGERTSVPRPPSSAPRVVGLVGKGITFDTGGYSIKTYEGMLEMKGDMAGAAAVLGTMSALRALNCPVAVEATLCAAENMISGEAFRPGDILTALNGVTIEVLSTDAEGRLVLADGLIDTARRGATELIDLATLTGAAIVALGEGTTALFATDDQLADRLLAAAAESGERMWRMPLIDELNDKIRGDVGDVKNSGGRTGGAITGALFLQRFSEGLPWAHLDIAGAARADKSTPAGPKGATGVGVRTLLTYLTT